MAFKGPQSNSGNNNDRQPNPFWNLSETRVEGFLGSDPTFFTYGKDGKEGVRFSIPLRKMVNGEEATDWLGVVSFTETEFIRDNFSKGSKVLVVGKQPGLNSYEKDGETITSLQMVAERVFLGFSPKRDGNGSSSNSSSNKSSRSAGPSGSSRRNAAKTNVEDSDDDLPF